MLLYLTRQLQQGTGQQNQQCTPQAQPNRLVQQRANHQQCSHQEQETKYHLDPIHPRARFGQEAVAQGHQQHQRRTDTQTQGKQHQTTVQRVATLRDIQQGGGQRCGHARANQQTGEQTEHAGTHQAAALLLASGVFQTVTQCCRQLQFEQAEHRQGQQDKQRGKAGQQPGLLQQALQVGPHQCSDYAQRGIHQRHAHHIGRGQRQTAPR